MIKENIEIINKLGLHARASTKFTQIANKFNSDIAVTRNDKRVNGKSIMGVMMLAAAKGATIEIEANGQDEVEALTALKALINNAFDEGG
ncbi:MAG: HPr family phosphocarrier protein [Methylophilaceae bacterium]|nr:HPr family phosphocarrier protein [Methylophilaceae bacterium]MDG1446010.1 HPr family phosphocarrier protein [Methylophilaceae bacterium]MDG1820852.1 HPr family phosphocarrier protein [Methylophilaceae bacterium]MDG2293642.1 HPr family phosphocarrier protein [Methylophilaceae bacterium]